MPRTARASVGVICYHVWAWSGQTKAAEASAQRFLAAGPVPRPDNWQEWVNHPQSDEVLGALRRSVIPGTQLGNEDWTRRVPEQLWLESTLRPHGRPRKEPEKQNVFSALFRPAIPRS